jgi:hypothetical protein
MIKAESAINAADTPALDIYAVTVSMYPDKVVSKLLPLTPSAAFTLASIAESAIVSPP